MGPFVLAWLVGETIIVYRTAKTYKAPPGPGQLLLSSGLFGILSLLAESETMRTPATIMAWGIDIASFMNLFPDAATLAGRTLGAVATKAATGKSQQWPPGIASNTVVIPDGSSASSATSTTNGSGSTNKLPPFNPNLTQ